METPHARVDELEAALSSFALRYSALEWIVEQIASRYLLDLPREEADAFLNGIGYADPPIHTVTPEGLQTVSPATELELQRSIQHIVEKVRERVHQGIRWV